MSFDPASLGISVTAIFLTLVLTVRGWRRDRVSRDEAQRADCVNHLVELLHGRLEPLFNKDWTQQHAVLANRHHIASIASMQGVSEASREPAFVRSVAKSAQEIQEEAIRYACSIESVLDSMKSRTGWRRAAILRAAACIQDELLQWQSGELPGRDVHSFAWHYFDALMQPPELPDDTDEWYEMVRQHRELQKC